ncbi:hypothetical protein C5167_007773 [Papaver somniferum]|uniref:protein DOWNSTREAM OF FLC-like n=1 Tax=Papaver somniferum TaxID=3469 RepID=UPI000E6F8EDC|nr:protein DOWNSTREAM OF FLC-like [Papaver somniferum]RZC85159.1 hypothetical protein C5167_007773 [Papaver somniferum]
MASPKVLILVALCVLPALLVEASRTVLKYPFHAKGRVYCDTCQLGCEHDLVTYIKGAVVEVVCRDRGNYETRYTKQAVTGEGGYYRVEVLTDHHDEICTIALVSSPDSGCNKIVKGIHEMTVVLTNDNGLPSHERSVNSLGFEKKTKIAGCDALQKHYLSDV